MLYRIIKRIIKSSKIGDLEKKINIFYNVDKLTEDEYNELIGLINMINNPEINKEETIKNELCTCYI